MSLNYVISNPTLCNNKVVGDTTLQIDEATALATGTRLPRYMFYVPRMEQVSGGNSYLVTATAWLQWFLEPKLSDPVYKDVSFDLDK